jgi:murein DD-endopeptidase MepM/ murein hydrolase activator NlpD
MVSSHYSAEIHHYGVDLVAGLRESVLATLDGVVIYTGYDPAAGNVIALQHKNGFISIYKHNESLLKETGNQVVAGEAIALIGNTGDLSTGPHLHFELWYKGNPVNPEELIAF